MNYIFHVRGWNTDFFLHLDNLIKQNNPASSILFFTMERACFKKLIEYDKKAFYLPELFEEAVGNKSEYAASLDDFMHNKYGYGIEFIYEMERFKPKQNKINEFVGGHINALNDLIPDNSKMIALSMDHFVYILCAYINEQKGGANYFVQPIGFPKNAQVILNNPFDLNPIREFPLDKEFLNEYIESLSLNPKDSIHYMQHNKNISLVDSFKKRLKAVFEKKAKRSIFTYLETENSNLLPSRWFEKKKISYKFNYYSLEDLNIEKKRVFYFPLQFEPEMSILAYSPWYKDQTEIIRLIAQSLKIGDILLLKENPKMIGQRDRSYYEKNSCYNNVRWADPNMNSREIIRKSFKVISVTGTATIEAACLGVNSMVFGYPPFRNLLIQKPISEYPISDFINQLYIEYPKIEIINHVKSNWGAFSKSVFIGNFIPKYINSEFTIDNVGELAFKVYQTMINRQYEDSEQ